MNPRYRKWLVELTNLATAAGREGRVVAWITRYAARRKGVMLETDRFGNLTLRREGKATDSPIYITAHMDHPAFVVRQVTDATSLIAEFRGGVHEPYFVGSGVLHHPTGGKPTPGTSGQVEGFVSRELGSQMGVDDGAKVVTMKFAKPVKAQPGDMVTWDVGPARIDGDRLHAPACDDLAGVAAAFAAFDALGNSTEADIRLLMTRAEEIGFIGAIAAARSRTIPKKARLICLENSKSYAESPIGGGPIIRVGDFTSTFDPDLTYRVGRVAAAIAQANPSFKWQRKLMPGGTCEASAFQSYGYTATCICLPLGNYHNMNESAPGGPRIDAETISLSDYDGLVRLLLEIGRTLDNLDQSPPLIKRLETLFTSRRPILDETP